MWDKNTSKLFLLGILYGFEKNNDQQDIEFNCTRMGFLISMSRLLREEGIPFHVEQKGVRLLFVTGPMKTFDEFLSKNFELNYNYPLKIKWPDFLDKPYIDKIPFIDGLFEMAGMYNPDNKQFPFVLHLSSEKVVENLSDYLESINIENIWVRNPHIKSLCSLQIVSEKEFLNKFLKTNPSSKYRNVVRQYK